jgi:hypothetical protein
LSSKHTILLHFVLHTLVSLLHGSDLISTK